MRYVVFMNYKTCTKCLDCKPIERFYYEKRSGNHLSICRECTCAHVRAWRKTQSGQKSLKETVQKRKEHGYRAKPYALKTPAERKTMVEAVKRWRDKNKGIYREEQVKSMFLKRSPAWQVAWPVIVAHYGGKCLGCGGDGVCFDHVRPLSQGGPNLLTNGQPLCRKCNTFKGQTEAAKDYRPDRGEWIRALVMVNPWLEWHTESGKRWPLLSREEKARLRTIRELAAKELVMPVQNAQVQKECGASDGGEIAEGSGIRNSVPEARRLTPRQIAQQRMLDGLIANLPQH